MSKSPNAQIILLAGVGSYLGWLIFTALNDMFSFISNLPPLIRLTIGLLGLLSLFKLGLKKQ